MDRVLHLREAGPGDLPALADLYEASVRGLGPERYRRDQVEAWAAFAREPGFRPFVLEASTLVAEREGRVVGFGGLTPRGRVASLYVHPDHAGRGVGTALLDALLDLARRQAMPRLHAEASELSRPVLERAGFRLEAEERVERRGARFVRYRMVLELPGSA